MLQATSPLRKPDDLTRVFLKFKNEGWDSFFSGAILEDFMIWEKDCNGILNSFNYDYKNRGRRQDRECQFLENGSSYIFKPDILLTNKNRFGGKIGIFIMDLWQSFEIDSHDDLELIQTH